MTQRSFSSLEAFKVSFLRYESIIKNLPPFIFYNEYRSDRYSFISPESFFETYNRRLSSLGFSSLERRHIWRIIYNSKNNTFATLLESRASFRKIERTVYFV